MLLIPDKISIPEEPPRLARPRLLAMLESSLKSGSSTVINGRAGTGKTALAVNFARSCGRPVAWYKIDASDVEFRVFLGYLVSSIGQQLTGFGTRTLAAFADPYANDPTGLADWFVYELLENDGGPLLVILEDIHLVCEGEWLVPFLCRLLPLLPGKVHFLFTSRTMPPAPLWRMRSKQTLEVIDEAMLAFTVAEAVELFETHELPGDLARAAHDRYYGRAGSLAACALSISRFAPVTS